MVIAGVEDRTRGTGIGKRILRHEISPAQLGRIDLQLARRDVHHALEREIELRPAIAAIEADRRLVGDNQLVLHRDVLHRIAAVAGRMHAIDRGRLGRPQIGTHVGDVAKFQADQLAVILERGRDRAGAVARRRCSSQMLGAILDPLDGISQRAAHRGKQHDIGEHRLLDAEAAAAVGRRDEAQPIAGNLQRAGHQGLQHERALEVGPHGEAIGRLLELGDDAEGFHRRRGVARIGVGELDHAIGLREGAVGIAVAEAAAVDGVRPGLVVQQRRAVGGRVRDAGRRGQRLVVDLDQLAGVLGDVARVRDHHGDRLADVAHAICREWIVRYRRAHHRRDRPDRALKLGTGDDAHDAREGAGACCVDVTDACVRMRRAQDGGMLEARDRREIVDEARAAGEQRLIFLARQRPADPGLLDRVCGTQRNPRALLENGKAAIVPELTQPAGFSRFIGNPAPWR